MQSSARSASRFAWGVLGFNIAVILWGAYVRASGSGAGCGAHWPLCNGVVVPRAPQVATVIEFTHRVTSGLAVMLVVALVVCTWRATRKRDPARKASIAALILILNEAWLGALLVLLQRVGQDTSAGRAVLLSLHFTNTLLLLAGLALCARWLGKTSAEQAERQRAGSTADSSLALGMTKGNALGMTKHGALGRAQSLSKRKRFAGVVAGLAAIVLVGASGSIAALGDTLFPAKSLGAALHADFSGNFLVRLRVIHPALAVTIIIFVLGMAIVSQRPGQSVDPRPSTFMAVLFFTQLLLGMLNVALLAPVWLQMTHLLVAQLFWIAAVIASDELLRERSTVASAQRAASP